MDCMFIFIRSSIHSMLEHGSKGEYVGGLARPSCPECRATKLAGWLCWARTSCAQSMTLGSHSVVRIARASERETDHPLGICRSLECWLVCCWARPICDLRGSPQSSSFTILILCRLLQKVFNRANVSFYLYTQYVVNIDRAVWKCWQEPVPGERKEFEQRNWFVT